MAQQRDILVLGGTGTTGRRIVDQLHSRGIQTRVGSRSGDPRFEWTDRRTWPAVLRGVSAVYIAYSPDLAVPGSHEDIAELASLAKDADVEKLVLLSGRGEAEAAAAERAAQASGLPVTILRADYFMQNFDEGAFAPFVREGSLALPVSPGVTEPFIDAQDIADVAVAALLGDEHAGRTYVLSGAESISFPEALARISDAAGRAITFESVPADDYVTTMRGFDVDEGEIALLTYLFREVLDGRNAAPTTGVFEAIGRQPRTFDDWARAAAAAGAFDA